ncbi:MAG TPA: YraN family protein [Bacilli bacterium]
MDNSKDQRRSVGSQGELLAMEHLKTIGYEIIVSNWKCKTGEIDIIAQLDQTLIVVEVRTRVTRGRFGTPQESVNYHKQNKVRSTAKVYIQQHNKYDKSIRFDVIAIYLKADGSLLELNHIVNAF